MTRINLIRPTVATLQQDSQWWSVPLLVALAAVVTMHWLGSVWVALATETRDSLRQSVEQAERAAETARASIPRIASDRSPRPLQAAAVRLRGVAASMPPDLWLVSYREHQGEALMRGNSLSDEATRRFVENLGAARFFGLVEMTESTRTKGAVAVTATTSPRYEFQVRATLLGTAGAATGAG